MEGGGGGGRKVRAGVISSIRSYDVHLFYFKL